MIDLSPILKHISQSAQMVFPIGLWCVLPKTFLFFELRFTMSANFKALGPNSGIGSGSLLVIIERQIEYAIAVAKKMQREHLKSVEVKKDAVADFDEYLEVSAQISSLSQIY